MPSVYVVTAVEENKVEDQIVCWDLESAQDKFDQWKKKYGGQSVCMASRQLYTGITAGLDIEGRPNRSGYYWVTPRGGKKRMVNVWRYNNEPSGPFYTNEDGGSSIEDAELYADCTWDRVTMVPPLGSRSDGSTSR